MRYSRKIKKYSRKIKKYSKKMKKHKKKLTKKLIKKFKKQKINIGGQHSSSLTNIKKLKLLQDNLNSIKDIFENKYNVKFKPYDLYYNVLKLKFIIEDIKKIINEDSISNLIIPDELENINIEKFIKSIIQNNDSNQLSTISEETNTLNFFINTDLSFNININELKKDYYDIILRLLNDELENKQTIFTLLNTSIHKYNEREERNKGTDKIKPDKQADIKFKFVYPKESLLNLITNIEQHTKEITYINYKNDYNNKLLQYHCYNDIADKQDICDSLKELKSFKEFNKDDVFKKKNFYCNKNNKPAFNFTTYNKENYCKYIEDNISNNINYYNESTDLYKDIDERIRKDIDERIRLYNPKTEYL